MLQLEFYLAIVHLAPSGYESVSALIYCLSGKALEWANAEWGSIDAASVRYEDFTRRFRAVYDHPPEGRVYEGMRTAQEFSLDFRTLAASVGWNERALIDHYRCSLGIYYVVRDTTLILDHPRTS
jgi:hypothetical protein